MARCSGVFCLFVCITQLCDVASAVKIIPSYTEIESPSGCAEITVPCIYSTNSPVSPNVIWYIHGQEKDVQVMKMDSNGSMNAEPNYASRLKMTESASLILKHPTKTDTGLYGCEVQIVSDTPMIAKSVVNLTITDSSVDGRAPLSRLMPGPLVMVSLVMLGIIIGGTRSLSAEHTKWNKRRTSAMVVSGSVLSTISILCMLFFVSESHSSDLFRIAGFICGSLGVIFELTGTIHSFCPDNKPMSVETERQGQNRDVGRCTNNHGTINSTTTLSAGASNFDANTLEPMPSPNATKRRRHSVQSVLGISGDVFHCRASTPWRQKQIDSEKRNHKVLTSFSGVSSSTASSGGSCSISTRTSLIHNTHRGEKKEKEIVAAENRGMQASSEGSEIHGEKKKDAQSIYAVTSVSTTFSEEPNSSPIIYARYIRTPHCEEKKEQESVAADNRGTQASSEASRISIGTNDRDGISFC